MLHRRTSTATRLGRTLASGLLCLSGLGIALAAPMSAVAADPDPAAAAAADAAITTTVCTDGHWPAAVQGRPRLHPGSLAGDYIWHDAAGWHLRVTHPGTRAVVFSGTIRSDTPLSVKGVKLEKQDSFTVSADRLSVSYRFVNHGRVDGLDLRTDCAKHLAFTGRIHGHRLAIGRIWIGQRGHHPLQNPFTVRRVG